MSFCLYLAEIINFLHLACYFFKKKTAPLTHHAVSWCLGIAGEDGGSTVSHDSSKAV